MGLDGFIVHLKGCNCSLRTITAYTGALRSFMRWLEDTTGSPFDPASVTPLDVADYRRYMLNRNRKPATINLHLDALSSFFSWVASNGLISFDPTEGVKRVPEQRGAPRWLTRQELGALMRAVQKYGIPRDRALLAILLHTGLRISEAVSLHVEDLVIRERSGWVTVREGKGGKRREVPLNVTARRIIQEWLTVHPGGDWLFPGRKGHMTARAAEKILEKYARLAGVEVTPHQLRHTFCKMLVDAGESLDRVAVLAGHSNLNTTARYTRPGVQDLEKAVEKLSWE
ncbi:integrase/recombinase XerC [Desulfofundulus australicus DSM 11792]|uniref:Integrase/recombinase XerC n=1 Tax=Desulfofundulus australicus DSM 11792 TaxID=1121425 RepID=A0A1M4Y0H3_9FIRM|nr:tyrosine-type recombinase/integrase [Desulfofundulus australicus]SHE99327.1 integrase/recombinase XerC [Desulfofundulus australicus DSM 11792]